MEVIKVEKQEGEKKLKFPLAKEYVGHCQDQKGLVVVFLDECNGFAVATPSPERFPLNRLCDWAGCRSGIWKDWHGDVTLRF